MYDAGAHFTKLLNDLNDPESRLANLDIDSESCDRCLIDIYFEDILPDIIRSDPCQTAVGTVDDSPPQPPSYGTVWYWLLRMICWS